MILGARSIEGLPPSNSVRNAGFPEAGAGVKKASPAGEPIEHTRIRTHGARRGLPLGRAAVWAYSKPIFENDLNRSTIDSRRRSYRRVWMPADRIRPEWAGAFV